MLFSTLKKNIWNIEVPLHLLVNWRWFLQVVDIGTVGIYIQYILYSLVISAAPKARDGRYCNAPRPSVCLSVCLSVRLSVTFSFRTVTQKTHCCIFSKLCRYVHQVMGVCCIVFDIDGMLFEFFMNFLNIEKNKILRIIFFKISCFLHVSCYFQH